MLAMHQYGKGPYIIQVRMMAIVEQPSDIAKTEQIVAQNDKK